MIEDNYSPIQLPGNASTSTIYPVPDSWFENGSAARVYADGVEIDFARIEGEGITTLTPQSADVAITITRETSLDQGRDFINNGTLPAEEVESMGDQLQKQIQELKGDQDRTVMFPHGTNLADQANTTIGRDENGGAVARTVDEQRELLGINFGLNPDPNLINAAVDSASASATSAAASAGVAASEAASSEQNASDASDSAQAAEDALDSVQAQIAAISGGQASPNYASETLAAAPSSANASGDVEFLRVYGEVSPEADNNGVYYREDAVTLWTKVPGDLTGRVVTIEQVSKSLTPIPSGESLPIHVREDDFGNIESITEFQASGQIFPLQKMEVLEKEGPSPMLLTRDGEQAFPMAVREISRDHRPVGLNITRFAKEHELQAAVSAPVLVASAEDVATTMNNFGSTGTDWTVVAGGRQRGSKVLKMEANVGYTGSIFLKVIAPSGATITYSNLTTAKEWTVTKATAGAVTTGVFTYLPLHPQNRANGTTTIYIKGTEADLVVASLVTAPSYGNPLPEATRTAHPSGSIAGLGSAVKTPTGHLVAVQNAITAVNEVGYIGDDGSTSIVALPHPTGVALDQHNGGGLAIVNGKPMHASTGHVEHANMAIARANIADPISQADWGAPQVYNWTGRTGLTYVQIFPTGTARTYLMSRDSSDNFFLAWSEDYGLTWPAANTVDIADFYPGATGKQYAWASQTVLGKVDFMSIEQGFAQNPNNIYHFYLDTTAGTFHLEDGTLLGDLTTAPLLLQELTPIVGYRAGEYQDGNDLCDWPMDSRLVARYAQRSSSGQLAVYYLAYQRDNDAGRVAASDDGDDVRQVLYRALWVDGAWQHEFVANQGGSFFPGNAGLTALSAGGGNTIDEVYFPSDADPSDTSRRATATGYYRIWKATRHSTGWRYEAISGAMPKGAHPHYLYAVPSLVLWQQGMMNSFKDTPISIETLKI